MPDLIVQPPENQTLADRLVIQGFAKAVKNLSKLNSYEKEFIERCQYVAHRDELTQRQFTMLTDILNKFE